MNKIDLTYARELLDDALEALTAIDGREVPDAAFGKQRGQEMADISKRLLALAHLCDRARVMVEGEYHTARGAFDLPIGETG